MSYRFLTLRSVVDRIQWKLNEQLIKSWCKITRFGIEEFGTDIKEAVLIPLVNE